MCRLFALILALFIPFGIYAQKDVTQFLGLAVDGTEANFIQALQTKGFTLKHVGNSKFLEGRFNGESVKVYVSTEKGKVDRVMVVDANPRNANDIRIRFNNLCRQFADNKNYIEGIYNLIPEEEDIPYEYHVKNKVYEASFLQIPNEFTFNKIQSKIKTNFIEKYANETEPNIDELEKEVGYEMLKEIYNYASKKSVLVRIFDLMGKYYIAIYYDNEYNRPHGEDL